MERNANILKKGLTLSRVFCILIRRSQKGYGILAQLGEHLPYKQRVTGSSPVGPTHTFCDYYMAR